MDGMRGSPTVGRVLCINSGAGLDQEKPPRQLIDETVAALVKQHEIGVVMVQEYRFKGGNSFNKFTSIRDLLPGGWRRWKVAQLEFDVAGMVPLILWDDALFDGVPLKLVGSASKPPTPGRNRAGVAGEEPFAGRYTAVMLTSKAGGKVDLGLQTKLMCVSYHGQFLVSPGNPQELPEEQRQANAERFVQMVGARAAALGVPALVGGDWSTSFGCETRPVPQSQDWVAELRPVAVYHPTDLECYRYCNSKPPVDFMAIVNPMIRLATVEVAGVTALAHPHHLQHHFDHDPLLACFTVSPGEASVIPPNPLDPEGVIPYGQRRAVPAARLGPDGPLGIGQLGELSDMQDQLQQELEALRREASGVALCDDMLSGASSIVAAAVAGGGGGDEDSELAGLEAQLAKLAAATDEVSEGGEGAVGNGTAASAAAAAGGSGGVDWEGVASQLASDLELVKEAAGRLLQQKNEVIEALQAKLRQISTDASEGANMPALEPVPEVFLTPRRKGMNGAPSTPEPVSY